MPKKSTCLLILALLASTPARAESDPDAPRREALFELRFGQAYSDPFRWMENPYDAELRNWVAAENRRLAEQLRGPLLDSVRADFQEIFSPAAAMAMTDPRAEMERLHRNGRLTERHKFRWQYRPDDSIPDLVPRESGLEFSRVIAPDGGFDLVFNSAAGQDLFRLLVVDRASGITSEVLMVRFPRVFWESNESFLYTTWPTGRSGGPQVGLYRHRVGTAQSADELLFSVNEPGESFDLLLAGEQLYMDLTRGDTSTFGRFDITTGKLHPIIPPQRELYLPLASSQSPAGVEFLFADFRDSPLGEIVRYRPDGSREVLVSQDDLGHRPLAVGSSPILSGDTFVVAVLEDTLTRLVLVNPSQGTVDEVDLPIEGTAVVRSLPDGVLVFLGNYTQGETVYELDVATKQLTPVFAPPPVPLGLELAADRVFYEAHNGQQVPIWIIRTSETELTPDTPMYFYGYGGFQLNFLPRLITAYTPWYARGGAAAIVTLPGGFEYGSDWHNAGRGLNKKNVFADFEAAAERLIELGYTQPSKLVAAGGSNGGLLVGAVINRRPELFGTAVPSVGVMDMLRYERFTAGPAWISEYGSAFKRRSFNNLFSYSPFHNIPSRSRAAKLPAVLVVNGDLDDRVVPGHSFKYAARLKRRTRSGKPVYMLTPPWSSHRGAIQLDEQIEARALTWTFMMQQTGMASQN